MLKLCVIGDPISHSRSPEIQTAMLRACGIEGVYTAEQVKKGGVRDFLESAVKRRITGINITMPLKEEIFSLLDDLDDSAKGAVNTAVWTGDHYKGYSTDGTGFINSLGALPITGAKATLFGAGGAAKVVLCTLQDAGALVNVCVRDKQKAVGLAPTERIFSWDEADKACEGAVLVVNATPLGMSGFPDFENTGFLSRMDRGGLVYDLIYAPPETGLLRRAKEAGLETRNGYAHLVHQAVLSFGMFCGVKPPERLIAELIAKG